LSVGKNIERVLTPRFLGILTGVIDQNKKEKIIEDILKVLETTRTYYHKERPLRYWFEKWYSVFGFERIVENRIGKSGSPDYLVRGKNKKLYYVELKYDLAKVRPIIITGKEQVKCISGVTGPVSRLDYVIALLNSRKSNYLVQQGKEIFVDPIEHYLTENGIQCFLLIHPNADLNLFI